MAHYKLHCIGASGNSYKIALYLNCAGLDWEPVGLDFAGGETRDADWRAGTNTMGEVPVLEVAGKRMSQSGAILLWLAETTGKFAPADDRALRGHALAVFRQSQIHRQLRDAPVSELPDAAAVDPAVLAFLRSRVESTFAIVDKHLGDRPFVLGDRLTIVDFSMAGYIFYPAAETGFDIAATYPAIDAWRRRIAALPGWKPPYEMMPVGTSPPVRAS